MIAALLLGVLIGVLSTIGAGWLYCRRQVMGITRSTM